MGECPNSVLPHFLMDLSQKSVYPGFQWVETRVLSLLLEKMVYHLLQR
jgi:hypothetical protein